MEAIRDRRMADSFLENRLKSPRNMRSDDQQCHQESKALASQHLTQIEDFGMPLWRL